MAAHEILERFSQIEKQAADPSSALEAVRSDDRICFRVGRAYSRTMLCVAVPLFLAVGAMFMSTLAYGMPWAPLPWCIAALVYVLAWWSVFRVGADRFVLDTSTQMIHVTLPGSEKTIDLNTVACFLAWNGQAGEDTVSRIYAVDETGEEIEIVDCGIDEGAMERNACILGFLCGKPAYRKGKRGARVDISGSLKTAGGANLCIPPLEEPGGPT